ncbi:MAG: tRNA (adenosine(37)-N6)-threonylcarbamoyltransferase complex ATPase subunit type 1 TsaE [Candidatus Gracilibacteria bacterium]|nr:tRNA (adenosine(37)-N6)-threonylcarbamoyltransferase complex ATPase subunit type 1 TsaE [Candidatus Gracilibacteria bacterium]
MTKKIYKLEELSSIKLKLSPGTIVFLYGDLASGKTTLTKNIIKNHFGADKDVTSPTYTYYQKYDNIYHFDLYRLNNFDEFINIGGEEILDNPNNICLIEWPEILEKYYSPNIKIFLNKLEDDYKREIEIIYV